MTPPAADGAWAALQRFVRGPRERPVLDYLLAQAPRDFLLPRRAHSGEARRTGAGHN